jgi:3-hydroxybutyryl-CoA dehydratase
MTDTPLPPLRIEHVDAEAMHDWADLLEDANPIHLDPAAVRALGLGDAVINQGPRNIAVVLNAISQALPTAELTGFSARLLGNVHAGDALLVEGLHRTDGATITCSARLQADGRGTVMTLEAHLRAERGQGKEMP